MRAFQLVWFILNAREGLQSGLREKGTYIYLLHDSPVIQVVYRWCSLDRTSFLIVRHGHGYHDLGNPCGGFVRVGSSNGDWREAGTIADTYASTKPAISIHAPDYRKSIQSINITFSLVD